MDERPREGSCRPGTPRDRAGRRSARRLGETGRSRWHTGRPAAGAPRGGGSPLEQRGPRVGKLHRHRRGGRAGTRPRSGVRPAAGRGDPPLAAVASRRLPTRGRLPGGADRRDRTAAGLLVGLRRVPQARGDRADLLLPGARHNRGRPRGGRSGSAQAAAHARRLALAGIPFRRAARSASGGDQRSTDRADRRRDRGHSSAETRRRRPESYAGLGNEIITDAGGFQTPRAYAATAVLFVFAVACFYALALAERRLVRGAADPEEETQGERALSAVHAWQGPSWRPLWLSFRGPRGLRRPSRT